MDPNACLRDIDYFLAGRQSGDEVDNMCKNLYEWIGQKGFEPDWSLYPLGTSYYRSFVIQAERE